jgi:hypothetical protein
MAKNLVFAMELTGKKWWPWEVATLGTLPEVKWPKTSSCQFFSGKILAKWWPWEVATLGTLPEVKWPKN